MRSRAIITVSAVGVLLAACSPFPFNVDLTLFVAESRLSGGLAIFDGPAEVPAGVSIDSGPYTWQVPLHDLRVALDLGQAVPGGPVTEATATLTVATYPDPEDAPLTIVGQAEVVLYLAPGTAENLWQAEWAGSGGSVQLGTGGASTVEVPLSEPQLQALSEGSIRLGLEFRSGTVTLTASSAAAATLVGFTYHISTLRVTGTAKPW